MGSFMDKYVKDRDDHKLFVCAVLCLLAAATVGVYDVVTVIRGTVDANKHMPFLLPIAFAAFGGIILAILRHGAERPPPPPPDGDGPYRRSYQHPDNWPRGRIDPPDGTSD